MILRPAEHAASPYSFTATQRYKSLSSVVTLFILKEEQSKSSQRHAAAHFPHLQLLIKQLLNNISDLSSVPRMTLKSFVCLSLYSLKSGDIYNYLSTAQVFPFHCSLFRESCLKYLIFTCRMNSFVTLLKNVWYLAGSSTPPCIRVHFTSGVGIPLTTALKMAVLPLKRGKKLVI